MQAERISPSRACIKSNPLADHHLPNSSTPSLKAFPRSTAAARVQKIIFGGKLSFVDEASNLYLTACVEEVVGILHKSLEYLAEGLGLDTFGYATSRLVPQLVVGLRDDLCAAYEQVELLPAFDDKPERDGLEAVVDVVSCEDLCVGQVLVDDAGEEGVGLKILLEPGAEAFWGGWKGPGRPLNLERRMVGYWFLASSGWAWFEGHASYEESADRWSRLMQVDVAKLGERPAHAMLIYFLTPAAMVRQACVVNVIQSP